jgi:Mrp family chromosome partitioning ATPase
LLIDGDLRKPDIAYMLNLPEDSKGLQDVLLGGEFERYVYHMPPTGPDVLAAHSNNASQAYELLVALHKARYIDIISPKYDHIIIDTPPVLFFPDALLWARIVGAVILTGFAGQTTAPALKEVKERLSQMNVNILGTVLSNVHLSHSYYRYAHNYYKRNHRDHTRAKNKQADTNEFHLLQAPMQEQ